MVNTLPKQLMSCRVGYWCCCVYTSHSQATRSQQHQVAWRKLGLGLLARLYPLTNGSIGSVGIGWGLVFGHDIFLLETSTRLTITTVTWMVWGPVWGLQYMAPGLTMPASNRRPSLFKLHNRFYPKIGMMPWVALHELLYLYITVWFRSCILSEK